MFKFLSSLFGRSAPLEAVPLVEEADPTIPSRTQRVLDINGLIRQASTKVPFGRLLQMRKKAVHLLSLEKINELINRAVKNSVDKYRIVDGSSSPVPQARIEAETRQEFDQLLSAYLRSAQDGDADDSPFEVVHGNPQPEVSFERMELRPGRGLHVGTVNLVAAAQAASMGDFVYATQRNAFLDVRADADTRKMMRELGLGYIAQGDDGYITGDAALVLARIFGKTPRRPMKFGTLSPGEPVALFILSLLVKQVLGYPRQEGEICVYSVPGDPVEPDRNFIYHRGALESALKGLGYAPRPMVESHLIVSSELKEQDYTGIGVSCGAGMFNVGIAYKGLPALSFSTSRGGDWVDESVAGALGMPVEEVRRVKESMDLKEPKGRVEGAVAIYYRNLLQHTLEVMKQKLSETATMPNFGRPIPIVCAGGAATIPGFLEMFKDEVEKARIPILIDFIRLAKDPLKAVAAGCLQAAIEETSAQGEAPNQTAPVVLERAALSGPPKKGLPSLQLLRQRSKVA
jgi:hypothetical protein